MIEEISKTLSTIKYLYSVIYFSKSNAFKKASFNLMIISKKNYDN